MGGGEGKEKKVGRSMPGAGVVGATSDPVQISASQWGSSHTSPRRYITRLSLIQKHFTNILSMFTEGTEHNSG